MLTTASGMGGVAMIISRRAIFKSAPLVATCLALPQVAHSAVRMTGCYLSSPISDPSLGAQSMLAVGVADQALVTSSGDAALDRSLGRALLRLANQFDVYPGFGFFDDGNTPNALASPQARADIPTAGTTGTVLFGINLFRKVLGDANDQGIAVLAVCAHEFAHIYQYNSGIHSELKNVSAKLSPNSPVKLSELHADYLAGYFLALRKAEHPDLKLWAAGALIDHFGDTNFNSQDHHGTSEQRVSSIQEGFGFGRSGKHGIREAALSGYQFVIKMFG